MDQISFLISGLSGRNVGILHRFQYTLCPKNVTTLSRYNSEQNCGYMCNLVHAICCRGAKIIVQLF